MAYISPTPKLSRLAERKLATPEQEWEDVEVQASLEESQLQPHALDSSEMNTTEMQRSPPPTPRRRRVQVRPAGRPVYIAASTASSRKAVYKQAKISPVPTPPIPSPAIVSQEEFNAALRVGTRSTAKYTLEVLSSFFYLLKKPLAILLVLWVIAVLSNMLLASLRAAFAPLCFLPGMSKTALCSGSMQFGPDQPQQSQHAEFPRIMEIQSKAFDQLLDESAGGTTLALDIKKTEMATKDLVTVVKSSDIRSRMLLAEALDSFVGDAKETGRGLQTLNARINGAVDRILAVSDYVLQTIDTPQEKSSLSTVAHYLWPFGAVSKTTDTVDQLFEQSFSVLSIELERLILTAETSQTALDGLEEKLATVHDILARENFAISAANDELLAELWTRLGGNKGRVARFASNLELLKGLGGYRDAALARVSAALQTLQQLSADMEELRSRASAPELLTGGDIPIEVHARAIRTGVERLNDGRLRAKQLGENSHKQSFAIEDS